MVCSRLKMVANNTDLFWTCGLLLNNTDHFLPTDPGPATLMTCGPFSNANNTRPFFDFCRPFWTYILSVTLCNHFQPTTYHSGPTTICDQFDLQTYNHLRPFTTFFDLYRPFSTYRPWTYRPFLTYSGPTTICDQFDLQTYKPTTICDHLRPFSTLTDHFRLFLTYRPFQVTLSTYRPL